MYDKKGLRKNDQKQYLFLLNHNMHAVQVTMDRSGVDIITGKTYRAGDEVTMEKTDVIILEHT